MLEPIKQSIFKHSFFDLYHYHIENADTAVEKENAANFKAAPILIVYALVNRPSILDLSPQCSFIKNLCQKGHDVYLIDWGYPDQNAAQLTLKHYALDFIDLAVDIVLTKAQSAAVNLMGICQGGVLSVCYAAWRPQRIAKLIPIVTPIDFHTKENLITPRLNKTMTQQWVDELGNFPGSALNWFLTMLKPEHTLLNKFNRFLAIKDNPEEVRMTLKMEEWIHNTPDHPGQALIDFLNDFYIGNSFMKPHYQLAEEKLDWKNLTMPVLNVFALEDHLVPASASQALKQVLDFNPYYEELKVATGHIGLFVSRKSTNITPSAISDWLLKNSLYS